MSRWVSFAVGVVLWMAWSTIVWAVGIPVAPNSGKFWSLWSITLLLCLWYGTHPQGDLVKHLFEKKD
jgi:hypothetical protein